MLTAVFSMIRTFFSADSKVSGKQGSWSIFDFFIVIALIAVGSAIIYVILFPPFGTPHYP
jgi:hypothetical protein